MKLYPHWRLLLRKAWTVRLAYGVAAINGCAAFLPVFSDSMPHWVYALLSMVLALAIPAARIVQQPDSLGDE